MKDKNAILENKSFRYLIVFLGFLFALLLAAINKHISREPALIIFYIIPVSLVVWFSGPKAGMFMVLCSTAFWFYDSKPIDQSLYVHPIFFYMDLIAKSCFLFVVVYVLQRLKTAIAHEKEANDRKSAFIANVSHELGSPLTVMREAISLISDEVAGKINKEQKEIIETAKDSAERMIRLTSNLLDISKIEAGVIELKHEKLEISSLVEVIIASYKIAISKKQLTLKTDIPANIGFIWADKDKVTEIIVNLLSNAVKYTSLGGNIVISLSGTDKDIRFEIFNTDKGIAKEDIARLFNKFERISVEKEKGTGLGLSIVKDIVALHKGKIWVESELGKGNKFIFILPRDSRK